MPAPWGPHPPDHDAVVAEREPRSDEHEPVRVAECEAVMDEGVMMLEGEVVMTEGEIVMHHAPVMHAHSAAPVVHARSAVNGQGASRRGSAQDCKCSRRDDELAEHRVPPSGIQLRIDSRDTAQECSIAAEPDLRRAFTAGSQTSNQRAT